MVPICLSIAGSDPSGGAGIQADIKTFASLGCYGVSVITALTAQNTQSVSDILPVPTSFVVEQVNQIITDMPVKAVKIGMLWNPDTAVAISEILASLHVPVILDPILKSSSGVTLSSGSMVDVILDSLIPICAVFTPNISEAKIISGVQGQTPEDIVKMGHQFIQRGARSVLITGGDQEGEEKHDCLILGDQTENTRVEWLLHRSVSTRNSHGTGCALSSAITANLAKGNSIETSVRRGIQYVTECLEHSVRFITGKGHGGLDHFYQTRERYTHE